MAVNIFKGASANEMFSVYFRVTMSFFLVSICHDDVIKGKHFPRYWPFVRGIHRSPMNSPHKGQWREALMFSLICTWINGWVNNRDAGHLRRHRVHYDVTTTLVFLMICTFWIIMTVIYIVHFLTTSSTNSFSFTFFLLHFLCVQDSGIESIFGGWECKVMYFFKFPILIFLECLIVRAYSSSSK